MSAGHPLSLLARTFPSGAMAGVVFLIGVSAVSPAAAPALLDLHRDGIDVRDVLAFAWLFGHAAIVVHHVLPGIVRV